jgi:predicted RNase H-like HicB family nuclease
MLRFIQAIFCDYGGYLMSTFTLEYWQDDDRFVGRLRELPGCFSQGETLPELEGNIAEVYKLLQADVG